MEKMKFKTADGVDANIEKLAQIFPEAVTETKDANGKLVRVANLEALKTLLEGKSCRSKRTGMLRVYLAGQKRCHNGSRKINY